MEQTLNILIIEDSPADFLLVDRHLRQQGMDAECVRVDTPEALECALDDGVWNLILSDFSVPSLNFYDSFARIQSRKPDLPVILVSGSIGEEQAVELLKLGVRDFVLKDNLTRLVPAMERSLREMEDRKARLAAEESTRESEYRFRSIFNNSPIAIGLGRRDDGRLVEVNDAWLRLYGFERDEVIGRTTTELNLYARDDERNELIRIIDECGHVVNREVQLRRKNGDIITVQYSGELIKLREELFLQVMVTDISDRKRNEAAREAKLELLRICNKAGRLPELMQELMNFFRKLTGCEAIGVRLRDGDDFPYYETRGFSEDFVLVEKSLCTYDQQGELIRDDAGHPALDCMCGNILCSRFDPSKSFFTPHGSFWSSCTTELLASSSVADRQAKTRNRCNGEGYESVALIPLRYHNETFGLFQFNDREKGRFTPEKIALYENLADYISIALSKLKSDESLRESEQFNLQIISNAEEGIVVYGPDLRYRGWNPYMERLSGLPAHAVIGKHPLELFPFLKDGGVIERLEKVMGEHAVSSVEFPFHSPYNGKTGWAFDISAPLKNAAREIIGVIGMVRDITARKQAEEELQKKNAEIEQFLYTVSHDLRSPLVTVKTFMGFLANDIAGNDQERVSQDMQFINGAADKMKLLLDELLEMSRIDRVETPPVRVSLMGVLDGVLDVLAGLISERKVDIHLPDMDLMLFGDYPRLFQIWQNLVENAIKYSRNGSIPRIELGLQQMDGETVFFVKDNGIGIAPEYTTKIFGMFEKLNPKSPGAGLGLSMIKRIVEKCGGRVWAESEGSDKGSCFFFTLPHAVVQS